MEKHKFYGLLIMAIALWVLAFSVASEFGIKWSYIPMLIGWIIWGLTVGYQWGYIRAKKSCD